MFTSRQVPTAWALKPCLRMAIVVIEALHDAGKGIEPPSLNGNPAVDAIRAELITEMAPDIRPQSDCLVGLLRSLAVERQMWTAVYCRHRNPVTLAVELLLAEGQTPLKDVLKGFLTEKNFKDLPPAAGRVASSPLLFCDARDSATITSSLAALAFRYPLQVVITDWLPGSAERERIGELMRGAHVRLIAVQSTEP